MHPENNSNYIDWFELDPEIVEACYRHLPKVCSKVRKSNKIKTFWGDAFKSIKEIPIFVTTSSPPWHFSKFF